MKNLLKLQKLDLQIEKFQERELEIPKQKGKYEIHRTRLAEELKASEERLKQLQVEQRTCEGEIEDKQKLIQKHDGELLGVKKNEQYQALLSEMEHLRKQIGQKEERILQLMEEIDAAKLQLEEDRKRIELELKNIDAECAKIDEELAAAVKEREALEREREPYIEEIAPSLLKQYKRIRVNKKRGPAVVPLNDETCTGCHMRVTPQIVNEVMGGSIHACAHCGRLLYCADLHTEGVTAP